MPLLLKTLSGFSIILGQKKVKALPMATEMSYLNHFPSAFLHSIHTCHLSILQTPPAYPNTSGTLHLFT